MSERHQNNDMAPQQETVQQKLERSTVEIAAVHQSVHIGPLPPPECLEKYDALCPGAAERIIAMAERQSIHRQNLEKIVVKTQTRNSFLGVIFAFILGLTAIIGGVFAAVSGAEISGSLIGGSGIVTLAGTFIYGTNSNRQERQAKERPKAK